MTSRVLAAGVFFAFAPLADAAIEAPTAAGLSLQQLEELRTKGIPDEQWPALLETLGIEGQSSAVRRLIKDQQPFPSARLVTLLSHPRLAVRLGALDLLEDAAGETFGFDPWQEEPGAGANVEPLARWKTWAETGRAAPAQSTGTLTDETFRALALEIMLGQRERAERAMQRLDAFGLAGIAHIEAFLAREANLEPAPKAALKTAEYRLALLQALPKKAAGLARDLALGTFEAQSTALTELSKGGPGVLPVVADFLTSPDPLVRETATDAAFEAGKEHAVGLIIERLQSEKAESVLHAMLRGLGQHASNPEHITAIARFLDHPAENVVVSGLEAVGANSTGDVSAALAGRLSDARWRVRASALEAIGKRNLSALAPQIKERLRDADQFVRVTAVQTLRAVADDDAIDPLVEEFERQDDLKAPILGVLFSGEKAPPPKVWDALWKAPPEVILQCLDSLESRDDHNGKRIPYAAPFASHPNRDVAASALRLLASRGRHTALLLGALNSDDEVKQDAVLDQLRLSPGFLGGVAPPAVTAPESAPKSTGNPLLNRLYDAVTGSARTSPATRAPAAKGEVHATPADMRAVLERFFRQGSPRQRFRAAVVLASQRDEPATEFLLASLDTLSSLDRRGVIGALSTLGEWADGPALELAIRLLRDAADDVREEAIQVWIDTKRPERLAGVLTEFSRPGSLLSPDDLYGWEMDKLAQSPGTHATILDWAQRVLGDSSARESHKVLAVVLLSRSGQADASMLTPLLDAPGSWLRRATYRALGLAQAESRLDTLLRDDSAFVRATLPFLAAPHNNGWRHWFDDARSVHDSEDYERENRSSGRTFGAWAQKGATKTAGKAAVSPAVLDALEKLARDPTDLVRFEAQFSLLRLGRPVEPTALSSLVAAQPEDSQARARLGNFLESNYARLGPGYGVLVPLAEDISAENVPKMLKHFGIAKETAFTSFAALAKLAPAAASAPDLSVKAAPAPTTRAAHSGAPFRVVFFHKPGCRDCDRTRDMLARHAAEFPQMIIEERNINDSREAVLNEALSARFKLRDTLHQVTPAVFTQAGPLVREEITFPRLGTLLRKTSALPPDVAWTRVETREVATAKETITQRYEALSFGVVAAAGLLDGVNPCAFATIIFLLSYLQIARRTPREILAVGAAFISGVFLAYFLVGLGLAQVLSKIAALRTAGMMLNYVLAAFALVVAVLSFRDAQLAARGQLGEMTLQLPGMLKEGIRSAIRTGTRASRFILAAFVAGIVISLLELACTGQVYLPTILYMLRSGQTGAVTHLLFYNVAFITPLIVVFVLAWAGLRSEALVRFQRERTALVKVLTGVLFLLLTGFLVFGHALLARGGD